VLIFLEVGKNLKEAKERVDCLDEPERREYGFL